MRTRRGLNLVEVLVVIAIIGLLLQLLLPAVEMSRERARGTTCDNNLRQIGIAAQNHLAAHDHFPAGGWGWRWAGDPDRGFDKKQPGGWTYNLLPYLERADVRNLGQKQSDAAKREAGRNAAATPIPLFICPSRRLASTSPDHSEADYFNIAPSERWAKCDYAANAGDWGCCEQTINRAGPATLAEGDAAGVEPDGSDGEPDPDAPFVWSRMVNEGTGMIFLRSTVRPADVTDGLSHTYLIGEKYLEPTGYKSGRDAGDDHSWNIGFDRDIYRWTDWGMELQPRQDKEGDVNTFRFGSAHPVTMHFVFADGSVHSISYDISEDVHSRLSHREDGQEPPIF
jgi:prepilin-type N-terminal cleavage/methylation domain-containing protein